MNDDYDPMKCPMNDWKDPWFPLGKYILYHHSKNPRFGRPRFVDCGNCVNFSRACIPVGLYEPDHETDNDFRRAVFMHFDLTGNEVCEVYDFNYHRCAPWIGEDHYVNKPGAPTLVSVDDVFFFEDFDFPDKMERGRRIHEVMRRHGVGWSWGWGTYDHVVGDPLHRAHHEFCLERCKTGSYWVPSFVQLRRRPGEADSQKEFVHKTTKMLKEACLEVARVPGGRLDSENDVVRQKACRDVFVETQKQLARITLSLDEQYHKWDETVNVKAKPIDDFWF